jgi:transcriptional regulator with XRE-family HTH domain
MAVRFRVRELRKERGLTQIELAAKANVSHRALQDIETNKANPTFDTMSAVALALGVRLVDLLEPERADDLGRERKNNLLLAFRELLLELTRPE